jgi:hypothetical protein
MTPGVKLKAPNTLANVRNVPPSPQTKRNRAFHKSLTLLNICVYCTYVTDSQEEACMDTLKRTNRTVERLAKTSADSYKMVVDHVVAQQERNVRFAQGVLDDAARELRHQADSNRSVVGELVERAEVQRDAYRTLAGEWVEAYTDLLYAPFAYYRQGLRLVENQVDEVTFPIAGYDEMNVKEIGERLEGLTAAEIRKVREYEKRNKNRETLIEQFDRKLRAASA